VLVRHWLATENQEPPVKVLKELFKLTKLFPPPPHGHTPRTSTLGDGNCEHIGLTWLKPTQSRGTPVVNG